jgi:hypothetical protein
VAATSPLGVGLSLGGYGRQEPKVTGASRVYHDEAALRLHLDELAIRR